MLRKIKNIYAGAISGAAVAMAAEVAKEKKVDVSIAKIAVFSKILNKIAGFLILSYLLLIISAIFGVHFYESSIYSVMSNTERAEIESRLNKQHQLLHLDVPASLKNGVPEGK